MAIAPILARLDVASHLVSLQVQRIALIALLAAMLAVLAALGFMLRRWETGVHADPWNLIAAASVSHSERLRACFRGDELKSSSDLQKRLEGARFRLGVFDAAPSTTTTTHWEFERDKETEPCYEYGIIPVTNPTTTHTTTTTTAPPKRTIFNLWGRTNHRHIPFLALTYTSRILFLLALSGLIGLVGYYFQPLPDTPFELFMDSQSFGVKFLFALIGTAIALFWHAFFDSLVVVSPFARMARRPRRAEHSVLLRPFTTNIVSGAAVAVRQRHALLLAVALVTGVAEVFLPVLLANVPFALTQSYDGWVANMAASLAVLAVMALVLLASLVFSRWPHMPVDPRTLAGMVYYVERAMQLRADLCGRRLAMMDESRREEVVKGLGRTYFYGPLAGRPGEGRMTIEVDGGW